MMNTYLIQSKVNWIKQARQDLKRIYNLDHTPFTRKIYFYFFEHDNKKYVYKNALKFVYSNAETFTKEIDPYFCELTQQYTPVDVCQFLEQVDSPLFPKLLDSNDSFFVYEYVIGDPVEFVTKEEFEFIEEQNQKLALTPFYNSMTYNLVRTSDSIKLVDLKHFECKIDLPFFLYFYNKDNVVNRLFSRKNTDLEKIFAHVGLDYPVSQAEIILY